MIDKKLRELLGVVVSKYDGGLVFKDDAGLVKIDRQVRSLFVPNYFSTCRDCGPEKIFKGDAIEIEFIEKDCDGGYICKAYVTEEGYAAHQDQIAKWKFEVAAFRKNQK